MHYTYFGLDYIGGSGAIAEVSDHVTCDFLRVPASGYDALAARLASSSVPCVLDVVDVFFVNHELTGLAWERSRQLHVMIGPYTDKITAFYLKDEPFWQGTRAGLNRGWIASQLAFVAKRLKFYFPQTPCFFIEAPFGVMDGHPSEMWEPISPHIDWFGYDDYNQATPLPMALNTLRRKRGSPHQKLVLVPRAHTNDYGAGPETSEAQLLAIEQQHRDAARAPDVVGVFPYLWHSYAEDGCLYTGLKDLPATVQTAWKQPWVNH